jgi:hypothetical protein
VGLFGVVSIRVGKLGFADVDVSKELTLLPYPPVPGCNTNTWAERMGA